ncbi:MAG: NFACT family protein [Candidatus Thermoplasmatota archaeon]|nr:NFACT family protein [Candidatus Thermoplasmatota archaeon]
MKKSLSGVDLRALITEMPQGYIKKFGIAGKGMFVIKAGAKNIIMRLAGWMYVSERETEIKKIDSLRYLENRRIRDVKQSGADRVVTFSLGDIEIVVELFGGGNLIVTKDGIIDFVAKAREFKDRKVAVGEKYAPPPGSMDFFSISFEDFSEVIKNGRYDTVRALAVDLGLGGEYAEELCARAGVKKEKKATELSKEELELLHSAIRSMEPEGGYVYYENGSAVSVMPFESYLYKDLEREKHRSFSEAIEAYIERMGKKPDKKSEEIRRAEEELKKTEEIINEIYSRYDEVYESKSFHDFTFDPDKTVEQNMQVLYERRKAMKEKIKGLKRAKEMESAKEKERKEKEGKKIKEKKTQWYERYWWFFTTEDFLVIAGKNARDNERIVKRYLTEEDFYAHADIHGGSSGVIKSYGREPSEITFKEACHFVACFSKAWGSISSCDAYWVRAEQVSKKPPTGQFLQKGSFMIYGKKNYYRRLPMKLTVGVVNINGEEKAMCAPDIRSEKRVTIVTGKKSVEQAAREISELLGVEAMDVAKVLPTRGVEIENTP